VNIQALAAQAGFIVDSDSQKYQQQCIQSTHSLIDEPLAKFMKLVAAQVRKRCIDLVLMGTGFPVQTKTLEIIYQERERIADLIRAEGENDV